MTALLGEARAMGAASVELLATEAGKPVYDRLGFQLHENTFMRILL